MTETYKGNNLVILLGVPGSGKSEISALAVSLLESKFGIKYKIVNYGDVIIESLKEAQILDDKDGIKSGLPYSIWREHQNIAAEKISDMKGNILLTTHSAFRREEKGIEKYFAGLPFTCLDYFTVDQLVYLDPKPKDVLNWRLKDTSRKRGSETVVEIKRNMEESKHFVRIYCGLTGAPYSFIPNVNNRKKACANKLCDILRQI